jgi:hypothetical protein
MDMLLELLTLLLLAENLLANKHSVFSLHSMLSTLLLDALKLVDQTKKPLLKFKPFATNSK